MSKFRSKCRECNGSGSLMDSSRNIGISAALAVNYFPKTRVCNGCGGSGERKVK